MAHDVEHTATPDAGRILFAHVFHRHFHGNARALAQPQEVHMNGQVLHRIQLHITRQRDDLFTFHVKLNQRGFKTARQHVLV